MLFGRFASVRIGPPVFGTGDGAEPAVRYESKSVKKIVLFRRYAALPSPCWPYVPPVPSWNEPPATRMTVRGFSAQAIPKRGSN